MPTRTAVALFCSLLAAACAHEKKPVEGAIEVHGRLVHEGEPVGGAPRASALAQWWAAVPMSGRCELSECLKHGWRTATPDGVAVTRCEFGSCAGDGWITRSPDGTASRTRCRFRDCWKDGWITQHEDGTTVEVKCAFGNCLKDGWTAAYSDGRGAVARCLSGDCVREGWTLSIDGESDPITCRCELSDCEKHGAVCR